MNDNFYVGLYMDVFQKKVVNYLTIWTKIVSFPSPRV